MIDIKKELDKLITVKDLEARLNQLSGLIERKIREVIKQEISKVIKSNPEFNSVIFEEIATNYLASKDFIDIKVTDNGAELSVKRREITRDLYNAFRSWKTGIKRLRKTLRVDKRYPVRNSNYFLYLVRKDKTFTIEQRLQYVTRKEGFLYIILKGNLGVNWVGIAYGGFSPWTYSGIDFIRNIENNLSRTLLKELNSKIKELLRDSEIVFLNQVEKTRFVEQLLDIIDEESSKILEQAAIAILEGRRPSDLRIIINNKVYDIIITAKGRLGVRYSLKYNRRSKRWQ